MRKLTKKISMLMVLAMLVGLFSGVVSASAASKWAFKSGKYDVAVGGEINMQKDEFADFDLLKDGKAPEDYTVVWASSDEDVVWVNAESGKLRADKFGKAEDGDKAVISATFTNVNTGKSATRSFTIVVGEVVAPVFTVECADVTVDLGAEIKFAPVVKNEAGEVVKFAEHKSYNGYFLDGKAITNPWTPEEAGEYTVTVAQFAAKADVADLAKAVRKAEVKVTVVADDKFEVEQVSLKSFTMTFAKGKDLSKVTKSDVYVGTSAKADASPFKEYINGFEVKDNVITVTLYNDLAKDTYVTVKFADESNGYKVAVGDVAKVVIKTEKVKISESTEVKVVLLNEQGIDITTPALLNKVTLKNLSTNVSVQIAGRNVMYWAKDTEAAIQAIYHTYDYKTLGNGQEVVVESEPVTIKFVDEVTSLTDTGAWTVVKNGTADWQFDAQGLWGSNNKVAIGDANYQLVAKLTRVKSAATDATDSVLSRNIDTLTYTSSNKDVLYVAANGILHPVKEGFAEVIIKSGDTIIGVYPVAVVARRVPTYVTIGNYKTVISKVENLSIPVTVYDQYDAVINTDAGDPIKVAYVNDNNANWGTYSTSNGSISINNTKYASVSTSADYTLAISSGNSAPAYISFTVKKPEATAQSYAFSKATQEAKLSAATGDATVAAKFANVNMNLASFDKYGLLIDDAIGATITVVDNLNTRPTDTNFYVTVTADNNAAKEWVLNNNGQNVDSSIVSVDIENSAVVLKTYTKVDALVTAAPAGTYTFTLYKGIATDKNANGVQQYNYSYCGNTTVVVKDEQKKFTAALVNDVVTLADAVSGGAIVIDDINIIKAAYKFTYDGNGLDDAAEATLVFEAPTITAEVGSNVAYADVTVVETFTMGTDGEIKIKNKISLGSITLTVKNQ